MKVVGTTIEVSNQLLQQMEAHALSSIDMEVCGLVYQEQYVPIKNRWEGHSSRYSADPVLLARAMFQYGEPHMIFHTHPDENLFPSNYDVVNWYYPGSAMGIGVVREGRLLLKAYRILR